MVSANKELNGGEIRNMEQNNIILIHGISGTIEIHVGRPEGRRATRHSVRCASLSLWRRGWVDYERYLKGVPREEIVNEDVRLSQAKGFVSGQR